MGVATQRPLICVLTQRIARPVRIRLELTQRRLTWRETLDASIVTLKTTESWKIGCTDEKDVVSSSSGGVSDVAAAKPEVATTPTSGAAEKPAAPPVGLFGEFPRRIVCPR